MTQMLQVAFLAVGCGVGVFALAFLFKRYQRAILWGTAILLFIGTSVCLGLGGINIFKEGQVNHAALLGVTIAYIYAAVFVLGAEKVHKLQTPIITQSEEDLSAEQIKDNSSDQPEQDNKILALPDSLNRNNAEAIFNAAIGAGLMETGGSHYQWKKSKVLLAYLCGRLYCGDISKYSPADGKSFWKPGRTEFFPDTELCELFQQTDIGQSRQNRKELPVPLGYEEVDKLFEQS